MRCAGPSVDIGRRELLRVATAGLVAAGASSGPARRTLALAGDQLASFDVRSFGATGDGTTLDTRAVNQAIAAATAAGGVSVRVGPGVYLCHSIRLESLVTLRLEPGAIVLAAPAGGYD